MGLSWQQGPLASGSAGRFLVPEPLPNRLLYAEPMRRRMRVKCAGAWIADSEDVVLLLLEPGQSVIPHGIDRELSLDEAPPGGRL